MKSLFNDLDRYFVGFDEMFRQFDKVATTVGYPPYNIKKLDNNHYTIEMAVAGFAKSDIDIELEGGTMRIKGKTAEAEGNTIYQGIANRAFTREFKLADTMVIKNAELVNGMLKIVLDNTIAIQKAIKIPVTDQSTPASDTKVNLMEDK